jgi:hypothetical protein
VIPRRTRRTRAESPPPPLDTSRAAPTTVRMDRQTLARLEAIAGAEERSLSYVIFRLVLRGLRGYDADGRLI